MVYRGSGGPPPSQVHASGGSGLYGGQKPFGFGIYEVLEGNKKKKVSLFRVNAGEKNVPFVFLDEALPKEKAAPAVRVHDGFKFNGKFGNTVICVGHRPEGCPMDKALERKHKCFPNCKQPCPRVGNRELSRGSWRWVATGIKMQPFTYNVGPKKGETWEYQRCLLLVPDAQYEDFMAYREQFEGQGGLRGKMFKVQRGSLPTSSKIGTSWRPAGSMTDEEMMDKFESSAAFYGMPVEQYIRPYDYEKLLKEYTKPEMADAAKWVAAEYGVSLEASGEETVSAVVGSDEAEDDAATEVPF